MVSPLSRTECPPALLWSTPVRGMSQPRFGGELPLGCDRLLRRPQRLPGVALLFHGRAALVWLLKARGPFRSAAVCAYTCPTVPRLFASLGLRLGFFDHDDPDPTKVVETLPGRCLVLLPAPFGMEPWCSAAGLAGILGDKAMVVIDAAQTAFGHLDFAPPPGGAVLSGRARPSRSATAPCSGSGACCHRATFRRHAFAPAAHQRHASACPVHSGGSR